MSCQRESGAVEAALARVTSLQDELASAPPSEKPRIIAEINSAQLALDRAEAALAACEASQPVEPPKDPRPGTFRIHLDYLSCYNSFEGTWGGQWEEPYLMVFPLLINLQRIADQDYIHSVGASHGNVGYKFAPGTDRFIASSFSFELDAGAVPVMAGVIVLCFEEDFTPHQAVRKAYDGVRSALNEGIQRLVDKVLAGELDLSRSIPDSELEPLYKAVKDVIFNEYKHQPFNADDFIGADKHLATLSNEPRRDVIRLQFRGDGSEYGLIGRLAFDPS